MHKIIPLTLAAVLLSWLAPAASARADEMLARRNACMSCHQVDRKMVGPAFSAVAQRHAGESGAADMLADKIIHGSQKAWGPIPMPSNPRITPADAHALATWILSLVPRK